MKSEFYLGANRVTIEQQLIEKMFYETFMIDNAVKEPIQVLGEAYLEEQKKDIPDLSAIRFAQGELYFHFKDYESAIFKWENIQNDWLVSAQRARTRFVRITALFASGDDGVSGQTTCP